MSTDPAVTAVSEALLLTGSLPLDAGERAFAARVAVAVARPIIEAEVRERIAAECRAEGFGYLATRVIAGGTA